MSTALYRRYRPQTFADVIGQEHVTEPLMQALRTGRFGHAYLFSGPRGCGKTTSARILARCLNCEHGPTATPCGECESCVALARGGPGSVDVIEIDAASHGGVDDARDLREKAAYGPAQSRFKVYIIDEAHMVTPQGFNALLKIVEEPPEHVKFVFATTEPEKVIGTIRSRTHHYPFRLVPPARLQDYLQELCDLEGIAVEPGVLSFVIRAGGGSVRDSLSVLDQLMAGSGPDGLTYAGAAALLGFTEGELLDATIDALAAGDGAAVFRQIDKIIETGHDPRRFVEDLLERLRDLIILAAVGSSSEGGAAIFRSLPSDQLDRMRQQAASFGPGELSHSADVVNAGLTEMTGATSPRLQLELICARLLLPGTAGEHGYAARIDRIERRLEVAGPGPARAASGGAAASGVGPGGTAAGAPDEHASAAAPTSNDPMVSQESVRPQTTPERQSTSSPSGRPPSADASAERRQEAAANQSAPGRRGQGGASAQQGDRSANASETAHATPTGRGRAPASPPAQAPRPAARGGLDTDAIRRSWPDVLAKIFTIRRVTWTFLSEHAQVLEYDGQRLLLGISTVGLANTFRGGSHHEVVRQALIEALGVDTKVEGVPMEEAAGARAQRPAPGRESETDRAGQQKGAARGDAPHGQSGPSGPPPGRSAGDGGGERPGARTEFGQESPLAEEPPPVDPYAEPEPPYDPYRDAGQSNADASARPTSPSPSARPEGERPDPRHRDAGRADGADPDALGLRASAASSRTADHVRGWSTDNAPPAWATSGPMGGVPAEPVPDPSGQEHQPEKTPASQDRRVVDTAPVDSGAPPARGIEAFRQARKARLTGGDTGEQGGGAPLRTRADDSAVSVDDEDINDLSAVGQPVIASILGGKVIAEKDE